MNKKQKPDKICHVGGREFLIYREYDDIAEKDILIYPDFTVTPEYTCEGQPFSTSVRENCEYFTSEIPIEDETYSDCGGCKWFKREETPYDVIGVCMCSNLKQTLTLEGK